MRALICHSCVLMSSSRPLCARDGVKAKTKAKAKVVAILMRNSVSTLCLPPSIHASVRPSAMSVHVIRFCKCLLGIFPESFLGHTERSATGVQLGKWGRKLSALRRVLLLPYVVVGGVNGGVGADVHGSVGMWWFCCWCLWWNWWWWWCNCFCCW